MCQFGSLDGGRCNVGLPSLSSFKCISLLNVVKCVDVCKCARVLVICRFENEGRVAFDEVKRSAFLELTFRGPVYATLCQETEYETK